MWEHMRRHRASDFFLPPRKKQQNTSTIKAFTLEGKLLFVLFLCKQQVLLLIQNNTDFHRVAMLSFFFLYKIELLFIQSLCYSVILSQASSHTGFSVSVPMTTSLLFFSCLAPPLPPLRFKSIRKQKKACVASCLNLTCVGAFVITSSKVRTGGLTTDVTDAQPGCVWQTAGATNTQTLKQTTSLWGRGLQGLGNWVVYCKSDAGAPLKVGVIVDKRDAQMLSLSDGEAGGVLIKETQYFIISSAVH